MIGIRTSLRGRSQAFVWVTLASAVGTLGLACAKGDNGAGTSGAGGLAWSSSSGAGAGGATATGPATSVGSVGGASGSGVATTTVTAASGQGGGGPGASTAVSSVATSGSGGSMAAGQAVLLAGGANALLGAHFDGSVWTTTKLVGASNRAPSIAYVHPTLAVGVHRDATNGALTYESFDGMAWASPAAVGPTVTTQGAPSLAVRGASADVVFHGDDFKHYFGSYAGSWMPTAEAVKPGLGTQSFGPVPGTFAVTGQEGVLAFPGGDGGLFVQSRVAGAWQNAAQLPNAKCSATPALVGLSSGAELLLVYVNSADKKLMFATRKAGTWSSSAVVEANSYSGDPPALAAGPNGEAVLAFRGFDNKPYVSRFVPVESPPWSLPTPIAASNPEIASSPSLAAGIGGHDAELAYIGKDGSAYHAYLAAGVWSAPSSLGGSGLLHVAMASLP